MKTPVLFSIGLLISTLSFGQQWETLDSLTPYNLNDVYFWNDQKGIVVGENGRMLMTSDQGATWVVQNSIPGCGINSVFFITADSGWVVGDCGIYISTDGGANWTQQQAAGGTVFHDVHFANSSSGSVVADNMEIYTTHDGGQQWVRQTLPTSVPNNPLLTVHHTNADTAWVAGGSKIHRTDDGGQTWTLNQSFNTVDWVEGIHFDPSGRVGIAMGWSGLSLYTVNHSTTWNVAGFITPDHKNLKSSFLISEDTAFTVGIHGLIYVSYNAGSSWSQMNSPTPKSLYSLYFPSSNVGFAVGRQGTILRYGGINSVDDPALSGAEVRVSPNPASDYVQVELLNSDRYLIQVEILDIHGRAVELTYPVRVFSNQIRQINTQDIPAGNYLLRINTSDGYVQKKLILNPVK